MIFRWARHPGSAPIARDRLKVLLTHERTLNSRPDLLARVHSDIVAVICRHVTVSPEQVQVKMDRVETVSRLTIDIEVPASTAVPNSGEGIKGFARILPAVFLLGHLLAACSTYQVTSEAAQLTAQGPCVVTRTADCH